MFEKMLRLAERTGLLLAERNGLLLAERIGLLLLVKGCWEGACWEKESVD